MISTIPAESEKWELVKMYHRDFVREPVYHCPDRHTTSHTNNIAGQIIIDTQTRWFKGGGQSKINAWKKSFQTSVYIGEKHLGPKALRGDFRNHR